MREIAGIATTPAASRSSPLRRIFMASPRSCLVMLYEPPAAAEEVCKPEIGRTERVIVEERHAAPAPGVSGSGGW